MKKNGFTLAEVLITLGIIGVISAITLPSLMTDTTSAQIGPKLAKAVSSFEQANESLLNANSVDTLSDAGLLTNVNTYANALSRHFKISQSGNTYLSKDGMQYTFSITNNNPANAADPGHMQRIGDVTIDINSTSRPNIAGTDRFTFSWWNDGSLRPKGGTNWNGAASSAVNAAEHWGQKCKLAEQGAVTDYTYCAGHVFENNLKVLYR